MNLQSFDHKKIITTESIEDWREKVQKCAFRASVFSVVKTNNEHVRKTNYATMPFTRIDNLGAFKEERVYTWIGFKRGE